MADQDQNCQSIVVLGAGGFASEVINYLRDVANARAKIEPASTIRIIGVVDNFVGLAAPDSVCGVPFIGTEESAEALGDCFYVVATGTPRYRQQAIARLKARQKRLFTLIHPSAIVSADAHVGEGSIVAPFAIVNARSRMGVGSVANVFCSVGHDSSLGDYSVLSPYAALSGESVTGECCFLGTRATLLPKVKIGNRCQVDAHSHVKADTEDLMIITSRGEYRVLRNRLEN